MLNNLLAARLAKLVLLVATLAFSFVTYAQVILNLVPGWNLLGNSSSAAIDVTQTFGDSTQFISVWKWNPGTHRWGFYAPSMSSSALTDYARGRGYEVIGSVVPKEGFWVNATSAVALDALVSSAATLAENDLQQGWNLVGSADNKTPAQLNQALADSLNAAGIARAC